MDEELLKYIEDVAKQLNGQLRGVLDKKSKELNLELITITLHTVSEALLNAGISMGKQYESIEKLKQQLNIGNNGNGK